MTIHAHLVFRNHIVISQPTSATENAQYSGKRNKVMKLICHLNPNCIDKFISYRLCRP